MAECVSTNGCANDNIIIIKVPVVTVKTVSEEQCLELIVFVLIFCLLSVFEQSYECRNLPD